MHTWNMTRLTATFRPRQVPCAVKGERTLHLSLDKPRYSSHQLDLRRLHPLSAHAP